MSQPFVLTATRHGGQAGRFPALSALAGLVHVISTRMGPVMTADEAEPQTVAAMRRIAGDLGLDDVAWCRQVHGGTVLDVDKGGLAGQADALVTTSAGLGILGRSADCPLILIAMPTAGAGPGEPAWAVGMVHASWRATAAGITAGAVGHLGGLPGADPRRAIAGIAPSAGPCCYEVGGEVQHALLAARGAGAREFFQLRSGKLYFDLWRANAAQLREGGLLAENIHQAGVCTICSPGLFPSYRRDGPAAARFAAVIGYGG